jgi:hypothetical protein
LHRYVVAEKERTEDEKAELEDAFKQQQSETQEHFGALQKEKDEQKLIEVGLHSLPSIRLVLHTSYRLSYWLSLTGVSYRLSSTGFSSPLSSTAKHIGHMPAVIPAVINWCFITAVFN